MLLSQVLQLSIALLCQTPSFMWNLQRACAPHVSTAKRATLVWTGSNANLLSNFLILCVNSLLVLVRLSWLTQLSNYKEHLGCSEVPCSADLALPWLVFPVCSMEGSSVNEWFLGEGNVRGLHRQCQVPSTVSNWKGQRFLSNDVNSFKFIRLWG